MFVNNFCIALIVLQCAVAFQHGSRVLLNSALLRSSSALFSSSCHVAVTGKGIEITEALSDRVQKRLGKVIEKLGFDVQSASVTLSVVSNDVEEKHSSTTKKNSQKAEAVLQCKKSQVVKSEVSCDDMYSSIDLVSHKVATSLKKHNAKIKDRSKGDGSAGLYSAEEIMAEADLFDEEDLLLELDQQYRSLV